MKRVISWAISGLPVPTALSAVFCLLAGGGPARAADDVSPPDFSQLPACETPIGDPGTARADYNLGATGMRGWIFGNSTHSTASREILVRVVEPGSPADGHFRKFDLITGIGDTPFTSDAREALASALTEAEASGTLTLLRWRDGRETSVTLQMEVLGAYSATAPFDCPKTDRIIANSADYIATQLLPEKPTPESVARALNALFLLATGETGHLPLVRRYARGLAAEMAAIREWDEALGRWTWSYGYTNMFLVEYYLATGDATVLPAIENICSILARGQGIPGSWCHGLSPVANIMPGYGAVNSTGLVCFISMGLAHQAGVPVDQKALADSFAFFGTFAGRGGIPYGDHPPYSASPVGNGKSGIAAVAFTVMDAPKTARWFSRLAASGNAYDLYSGHTGNFWNHTWTPIGAHLAGRESLIAQFRRVRGNYELMRRWDHGYVTNPDFNRRECYAARRKYGGPAWGPGAFTLFMTAPRGRLRIFGAAPGIFAGGDCPAELRGALAQHRALDYEACLATLEGLRLRRDVRGLGEQLREAAVAAMAANEAGLEACRESLDREDYYLASLQARALTGVLAADAPAFADVLAALAAESVAELIGKGETYYQAAHTYANDHIRFLDEYTLVPFARLSANHRRSLEELSADGEAGIYQGLASAFLQANPMHPYQRLRHEWLPSSEYSPLTPIFFCAAAVEKDVPNTDVETLKFSPTPGERIAAVNDRVAADVLFYESEALQDQQAQQRKPVRASWAAADHSGWQAGALPIGGPDPRTGDKSLVPPDGYSARARLRFSIDDPSAFSQWFVTCKSTGRTEMYLNGTRIVQMPEQARPGYSIIHLKPASAVLFRAGENVLAVDVDVSSARETAFLDIGLDALSK